MNVLIIGASGKTGKLTTERAVIAGHTVTAFVRDASKYDAPAGVRVVAGDATDVAAVTAAMAGQNAVIDTIGGKTPYRETHLEESVAKAVLAAMKEHGVGRIIVVSALGVGNSVMQSGFLYEHVFLPTFLRGSTQDKTMMEGLVAESDADFIIVRPAVLNDHPPTGDVGIFIDDEKAHKITRADVAQFLVDQLTSDTYVDQAVTIANS